jgi:hypothetical protein
MWRTRVAVIVAVVAVVAIGALVWSLFRPTEEDDVLIARSCLRMAAGGLLQLADKRTERFLGKVAPETAECRGGAKALAARGTPWVDWSNYWATGDINSLSNRNEFGSHVIDRNRRGIDGALLDLEYQRMELIKFNLFDNLTFETYAGLGGQTQTVWPEMRLPPSDPPPEGLKINPDGSQLCQGPQIRFRTLTGICNDIRNPAMGSTGQPFARNVEFESTFPDLELNQVAKNRYGGRISLLQPDPQVISRRLLTRDQSSTPNCNHGHGVAGSPMADCAYQKAPFFNVLAAFWIQFMTHDWFTHLEDARNDMSNVMTDLGCATEQVGHAVVPLSPEGAADLGCRPEDKMDAALIANSAPPSSFKVGGVERLQRAYKTSRNFVTAWWDASQLYGYDHRSRQRVKRDPADPVKLLLVHVASGAAAKDPFGYLPEFGPPCPPGSDGGDDCDPIQPEWVGQEATAFPDNWSIGLSFYHNLFAREHNAIVDAFRQKAKDEPDVDSGLRNPERPNEEITYIQISDDELFEIARLIVAAEIAKIHTIEWTPQLLYNEPLYIGMNANWSGLFEQGTVANGITKSLVEKLAKSRDARQKNLFYAAFAAGAGIVGLGNSRQFPSFLPGWLSWDRWSLVNPDDVNGGTNHFGSPFNFPEEFVSVYRLHALVPDMIEFRDMAHDPNAIKRRVGVIDTFRERATAKMHQGGLGNWALSMGRQRLGLLLLRNHPQFLQNLDLRPRLDTTIDVAALDIIRDRERGIPRFNEFRRQIGLEQLTSFDDFIDKKLLENSPEWAKQAELVKAMREIYGQHVCDASKIITTAQRDDAGQPINDCLGHPDGTRVDNVEDVDLVIGFHAETTRPHGFAISETQFQIFILNASRRLFSDRFFTSSFRPEFYTHLGIDWVMNNGPTGKQWAEGAPNGHRQEVSPLKRVILRAAPELEPELQHVVNAFDPWSRDRGQYYSLDWKPREDARTDPAFK